LSITTFVACKNTWFYFFYFERSTISCHSL
jgi:hypothetical protein